MKCEDLCIVASLSNKDIDEFKNINTLLIFLDEIRDKNIIDIDKKLIAINKKGVVLWKNYQL